MDDQKGAKDVKSEKTRNSGFITCWKIGFGSVKDFLNHWQAGKHHMNVRVLFRTAFYIMLMAFQKHI
jgi:hypothetical protein